MFPLHDDNPTRHTPFAVYTVIGLNVLAWAFLQGFGTDPALPKSLCLYGLVPGDLLGNIFPGQGIQVSPTLVCRFDGDGQALTLISSMFMHGGWLHIIGNMW
ncbi:MAG: rhomboid family intramembrane serine protease, partial [Gammaproteobacteria bacterium]|nr:rhomboid family intramembrane serine protease [Gammaproteobacteria bacterium]